ncbi:Mmp37-domain-containing protein [Atractiella rhizophila]|nr:Mmp37-domain-containing protein [Atractiella rhizophila]
MSFILSSKSIAQVSRLAHTRPYPKPHLIAWLSTETVQSSSASSPPPPFPFKKPPSNSQPTKSGTTAPAPPAAVLKSVPDPPPPHTASPESPKTETPLPRPLRYQWLPGRLPASFGRNQVVKVPEEVLRDLEEVVSSFRAPIRYAFAYGSGVFRQKGYTAEDKPLLDFVFAVSHPEHWHAVNLQQNPHHYAVPMRWMGSGAITWAEERLGAGVWFNVNVEIAGKHLKYGVVSVDTLRNDLLDWETLYLGGRMHKPIKILREDPRIRLDQQVNLANSFRTSLLLLPETFSEQDLYETIAGLSYRGDFRMAVGENPNKVRNIVSNQLDQFRQLYGGFISSGFKHHVAFQSGPSTSVVGSEVRTLKQDKNPRMRADLTRKLPLGLRGKIWGTYQGRWNLQKGLGGVKKETEEKVDENAVWQKIVVDEEFTKVIDDTFNQSMKGVLSAGPVKSLSYVIPKLKKRWSSSPSSGASIEAPKP